MDDFVRNKLTEWGLSMWIKTFEDQCIDKRNIYCLDEHDIINLIPKVGPRSTFKMKLKSLKVLPSTSDTSDKEKIILSDVKNIMNFVDKKIPNQGNTKLNNFLRYKICDLETEKRELVGVFGKTGAGKSSLINAVIGEKNLLPSGSVSACTTVMIKVEANMLNSKYEAEIEFITKEEWKDELWSLLNFLRDNADKDKEDDDDYHDDEKLSAVYGEEWKDKSPENLMDDKYFREIPEFLLSKRKILTCESAKELSAKFVKFTRSDSKDEERKKVKRWYWPLVKCVTVRVPGNDSLQHVTLVDLPGNGDRNKSRDKMWKGIVGSCSIVWIVTDINRAAAEKEPWEILKSASSLMGNGGQCQEIHFICTKSDLIEDSDDPSAAGVRALIFKKNMQAKKEVSREFSKLNKVKKHFSDDCFKVFTVSSKEFLKKKHLNPDETEIPKLQEILQNLNDCHSETLNYVTGAYGILSLMQGAKSRERGCINRKTNACMDLEKNLRHELDKVREAMDEAHKAFEKCLSEGVERSKSSCDQILHSVLYPRGVKGGGFHMTLKCLVVNNGIYLPKKKKSKPIDLNVKLASSLTDSIDEKFKKTFPNEGKCGPFNGVINTFSLDTKMLIQKHKDVKLQLIFLRTEENKIKAKLIKIIRERKKTIYSSLMTTIEKTMQECYIKAAEFRGPGTLKNMRDTIEKHICDSKNTMFKQAKDVMLSKLRHLKEEILQTLEETMQKSIDLSLKIDAVSIPDVTAELEMVKKYYHELRGSPDGQTQM
ncbi:nuclear GTPase SLIP-GC-like [Micropterus dolomieu]|uniref:nuclear GTPase SLIP-GC-like n=1 Tax=Micropterus dolomieu TaxID=147949 RepID=UPI001E8D3297|nr:nuclear GTPase SLIP-GC-like [Micropterus dolomieu]